MDIDGRVLGDLACQEAGLQVTLIQQVAHRRQHAFKWRDATFLRQPSDLLPGEGTFVAQTLWPSWQGA